MASPYKALSINLGDTRLQITREWITAQTSFLAWLFNHLSHARFLTLFIERLRYLVLITWPVTFYWVIPQMVFSLVSVVNLFALKSTVLNFQENLGSVFCTAMAANMFMRIDQFRYIKIQPNKTDCRGKNPTNVVVLHQSLVLSCTVLRWILIYRNCSIEDAIKKIFTLW